jgi:hypothetical protein
VLEPRIPPTPVESKFYPIVTPPTSPPQIRSESDEFKVLLIKENDYLPDNLLGHQLKARTGILHVT